MSNLTFSSLSFPRYGDKENSGFFYDYLAKLLEERDRSGLSTMIYEIDAIILAVDPGCSVKYIGELCLMTPNCARGEERDDPRYFPQSE